MNATTHQKLVSDFEARFNKEFHHFMKNREERIALYNRWIAIIEQEEDEAVQPYERLIVCANILHKALYGDYDEIALYMKVAMKDMAYVLENDDDPEGAYFQILHIRKLKDRVAGAIVYECSFDDVLEYLDYVIDYHCAGLRNAYVVDMLKHTVAAYVRKGEHENAIKLGECIMNMYDDSIEEELPDYPLRDTLSKIDDIQIEVYAAYAALGIITEQQQADADQMKAKREAAEQVVRQRRNEERQAYMDMAERCRAAGDDDGYRGNMWMVSECGK